MSCLAHARNLIIKLPIPCFPTEDDDLEDILFEKANLGYFSLGQNSYMGFNHCRAKSSPGQSQSLALKAC